LLKRLDSFALGCRLAEVEGDEIISGNPGRFDCVAVVIGLNLDTVHSCQEGFAD
jgi:hypothetical protein